MTNTAAAGRAALIMAHPGHELRVLGWVSTARPLVQVLSDGAGREKSPRIGRSRDLLQGLGCPMGAVFGHASDRRFYQAMLELDAAFFIAILDRLTESVIAGGAEAVFGDAAEGYNPTHDICRVLIDAVVVQVRRRTGRTLRNHAFKLTDWPMVGEQSGTAAFEVVLDDAALAQKLARCLAYRPLRGEVDTALAAQGEEHFRRELFFPVTVTELPPHPHYQQVGEARVRSGHYAQVVGYRAHIAPLAAAIMDHARSGAAAQQLESA